MNRPDVLPEAMASLYPFKENSYQLTSGHKMHYVDEGEGEAVLMLHGNPTWSFFYRDVIKELKGTHRCIAPDHIGCGFSDKPANYSYRLEDHVNNILELVEELKLENFSLIVHDWGGPIGLAVAQKLKARVNRIVILNTSGFLSTKIPQRINICKMPLLGELLVQGFNAFAGAATFMAVKKPLPKDVKEGFTFPYNSWSNRIATHRFVRDIPMEPRHPSYKTLKNIEEGLPSLKDKPICLIWGGQDFCFTRTFYRKFRAVFPKAEAHMLEDAGHYLLEDANERVLAKIKRFLEA